MLYAGASALAVTGSAEVRQSLDLSGNALAAALFGAEAGIVFHLFFRGAMGEELGLRGFALPRLQARLGAVRASLTIGVFWYLWHLPVLIGRGLVELALYGVLVMLLTFIFTWLYNGSGGSLIPGLIFHAIQNSEDAFERVLPAMKDTDWEAPATLALFIFGIAATVRVVQRHRKERMAAA
jgi:membrane protease YdiL (CAAX protease family)